MTWSTPQKMDNALTKNLSPLPAGKEGKTTKKSIRRHHQANKDTSDLEAERVRGLGALHSLKFKKKLLAGKGRELHLFSNEANAKWIDDYVDRETTVARQRIHDAETAIMQEQEDMGNDEKA
jgi:hypothetical protein